MLSSPFYLFFLYYNLFFFLKITHKSSAKGIICSLKVFVSLIVYLRGTQVGIVLPGELTLMRLTGFRNLRSKFVAIKLDIVLAVRANTFLSGCE